MTRIVFIITNLSTGGAEAMLLKLLERLDRQNFEPLVISLVSVGEVGSKIRSLGIPVRALGMARGWTSLARFFELVRTIRDCRPDIVHTWLYHADLLGGLAAKLAGVGVVYWGVRSSNLEARKSRWITRVVRRICALLSPFIPNRIFFNSEVAMQVHSKLGYARRKMIVIPNGFDLSRFRADKDVRRSMRDDLGCSPDQLVVGMIGRYDPLKNQTGFVSAIEIVHRQMPQVVFLMVGPGVESDNQELVGLLKKSGVMDRVLLLGACDDMPRLLSALDVLASPSYAEAFPNVIGEAMASGVPCVATDVGDCSYIIGDAGQVVKVGDMEGLALCLESVLRLTHEQRAVLGQRARDRVAELFEIGVVVHRYEEVYRI